MNQKPMCLPACSDRIQIRLPFSFFVPFLCYYGCALVHLTRVSISVLLYGGLDCRLGGGLFVNLAFLAFPLQTGGINCVVVENNNNKNRSSSKKSSAVGSVQQNTEPLFPSQQHPAVVAGCPAGCGFPTFGKNNHSVDVGRRCVCVCVFFLQLRHAVFNLFPILPASAEVERCAAIGTKLHNRSKDSLTVEGTSQ